jgi:membrane protease YdiL (CAAX protease family)
MYAANRENPWVADVAAAPWRWRGWSASLAASVFAVLVLQFFRTRQLSGPLQQAIADAVAKAPGAWADILDFGALQFLIFGLFLIAAMVGTGVEGRRPWRRGAGAGGVKSLAGGLALGFCGFCAAVAIAAAAGAVVPGPEGSAPLGAVAFGAAVVILQAFSEEAFFRGWLQPVLCSDWGGWVGLIVTSALFAALHVIAGVQHPLTPEGALAVTNLFLGGMVFGLLALRTGNLLAPTAAHFAWNWTESGVLGLNEDPTGSLFNLKFAGARLWNGGAETMNGSLATALVLVALVTLLTRMGARSGFAAASGAEAPSPPVDDLA